MANKTPSNYYTDIIRCPYNDELMNLQDEKLKQVYMNGEKYTFDDPLYLRAFTTVPCNDLVCSRNFLLKPINKDIIDMLSAKSK